MSVCEDAAVDGPDLGPDTLEVLAGIAETGSLTRAAEALGVTQQAVSARLRVAERATGQPLVHRTASVRSSPMWAGWFSGWLFRCWRPPGDWKQGSLRSESLVAPRRGRVSTIAEV